MPSLKRKISLGIMALVISTFGCGLYYFKDNITGQADLMGWNVEFVGKNRSVIDIYNSELVKQRMMYTSANPNMRGALLKNMVEIGKQRQTTMTYLLKNDPEAFLLASIPDHARSSFPDELKPYIEEPVSISGQITSYSTDAEKTDESQMKYFVNDGQSTWGVYSPKLVGLESGTNVAISGIGFNGNVAVSNVTVQMSTAPIKTKKLKTAVILFNFKNNKTRHITKSKVRQVMYTSAKSVKKYYRENSYGKIIITGRKKRNGDTFGWYTIPYDNTSCNFEAWYKSAYKKASRRNKLKNYTNLVFAFPDTQSCEWLGAGSVGGKPGISLINGKNFVLKTIAHEIGHNLGLDHANTRVCYNSQGVRSSIGGDCYSMEYDDPFDVMGMKGSFHTNIFNKAIKSWTNRANLRTAYNGAKYRIYPMEKKTSGVQLVRIPMDRDSAGKITSYYYLEYRRPYGFDNFKSTSEVAKGILIRVAKNTQASNQTDLLDGEPLTASFVDAAFGQWKTFEDPIRHISVVVSNITAGYADVQIGIGKNGCVRRDPQVSWTPNVIQSVKPGEAFKYSINIKSLDSPECPMVSFKIEEDAPYQWGQYITPGMNFILGAGQSVDVTMNLKVPSNSANGSYKVNLKAKNGADLDHVTSSYKSIWVDSGL